MSDLSKQAGLLSLADFTRFFIKTLIGIGLARLLSPADLGSYRQLFLIYSTLSGILMLGFPQSMLYFLPKAGSSQEIKALINRTMNVMSILALLSAAIIFFSRHYIARSFNNPELSQLLIVYSIYPIFIFITQLYNSVILGLKEPLKSARFIIFSVVCDLVLVLGVAFFTRDIQLIVWAVVISAFIQWLWATLQLKKYKGGLSRETFIGLKGQLSYTIPLGLSLLIGVLSVQLDKLMISSFFTPEQFAVFSLGAMELPLIGILINSVNAILLPNMSTENPKQMATLYSASVRKNAIIVFPLATVFFIFATEFMVFLYGNIYADAALYFRIYLLILPLRVATYGIIFQALGKTRLVMIDSIIMLIMNATLNFFLIKVYGMQGAAIATVIVSWLIVLVYLLQIKYSLKMQLTRLFPMGRILLNLVAALLPAAIVLPLTSYLDNSFWRMILGGSLYMLLYLLAAWLMKVIKPYDLKLATDFAHSIIKKVKR
ncbi:MAG: oligosaccharide flippase family protein [Candidatus Cloacimonetes bacterium]|nr:oligosaccharide flippase family protein [Candidatus Cloacimonadota bacterium]MDD4277116.1 oligosaccharide flippase family protein [Candidatus Cloacimonadota bacterium]